ncbi:hypothetical protein CR513_06004, partial [Mucuna pruriens]
MKTASSIFPCIRVNACVTDTSQNGSGKCYKYLKHKPMLSHQRSRSCSSVSPNRTFRHRFEISFGPVRFSKGFYIITV